MNGYPPPSHLSVPPSRPATTPAPLNQPPLTASPSLPTSPPPHPSPHPLAGEQITIDYATFCTEHMAAFDCCCGAATCRGRVSGADHLADWVGRVYGHHVSTVVAGWGCEYQPKLNQTKPN